MREGGVVSSGGAAARPLRWTAGISEDWEWVKVTDGGRVNR